MFAVLFLSGACGLVYEVVWMRVFGFVFGNTAFAISAVLCSFMTGLGLGSYLLGRYARRDVNPLALYALLELIIALSAVAFLPLVGLIQPVNAAITGRLLGHTLPLNVIRYAMALMMMIVPTTCMGGTIPVLGKFFVDAPGRLGRQVAKLYAVNTFGAVAGCLLAGFVLVPYAGLRETLLGAAAAGVLIFGLAMAASRRIEPTKTTAAAEPISPATAPEPTNPAVRWLIPAALAASGFTGLGCEVIWSRTLVAVVRNSTYVFSIMLAVYLAGWALGSALIVPLADRSRKPVVLVGLVWVLLGLAVPASIVTYRSLDTLTYALDAVLPLEKWWANMVTVGILATLTMLPTAMFSGMTVPLATRIWNRSFAQRSRDIGAVYLCNTFGAIGGSVFCGFAMVPLLGLRWTVLLLGALNFALGAACVLAMPRARGPQAFLAVAATALVLEATLTPRQFFREFIVLPGHEAVYYREGPTDVVMVLESPVKPADPMFGGVNRALFFADGRGTAGTMTVEHNRFAGHLPMLLHPNPKRALALCLGAGNMLDAMSKHPSERLVALELSKGVIEALDYFPTNERIADNRGVEWIVEDARIFLQATGDRFDVITNEPPWPDAAGVVNLYTREFYEQIRDRLAPGGICCQWFGVHRIPERDFKALFRSFMEVFPHTALWKTPFLGDLYLVGSVDPFDYDYQRMKAAFDQPAVRANLEQVYLGDLDHLLAYYICDQDDLREYVAGAPLVTDDRTRVDFTIPQSGIGRLHVFGRVRKETRDALYLEAVTNLLALCDLLDRTKPIYPRLTNVGSEVDRVRSDLEHLGRLHAEMHGELRRIVEECVASGGKKNMEKVAPALVGLRHKYVTGRPQLAEWPFR